jgi:predicted RNase H-like HicB family nuclease
MLELTENKGMKLTAAYKKVDDWWAASIEEIPGVHTQGATFEEARENLKDALQMVLEVNRELAEKENEATRREEFIFA